jgi:hypothetical protein
MTRIILTECEGDCMLSIMSHDQGFLNMMWISLCHASRSRALTVRNPKNKFSQPLTTSLNMFLTRRLHVGF